MADKIASGSWHESPSPGGPGDAGAPDAMPPDDPREAGRQRDIQRFTNRRDAARWSAVVGFLMMFGAPFFAGLLIGGVGMVLYGALASLYWSRRLAKAKGDPWAYDAELDGPKAPDWTRR